MIMAKIYGGLGNQLFQYAAGYAIAKGSGTPLMLDVSAGLARDAHNRVYCLQHYNLSATVATAEQVQAFLANKKTLLTQSKYLHNKLGLALKKNYWHQHYIYQNTYDNAFAKAKCDDVYLEGFWQNENLFIAYKQALLQELTITAPLNDINAHYTKLIHNTHSVALHIRRGDALRATAQLIYNMPSMAYYNAAVQHLVHLEPHITLYIFSDDIAWCKQHVQYNLPTHYMDINDDDTNYADLYLMQQCKYIITANSTFSWWGAWLSTINDRVVITPKLWFHIPKWNNSNLIPKHWIKL